MSAENRNIWSDTLTRILLDEYQKNELLWNSFSPFYTNKKKREEGYNNIINALNSSTITIRDIKMKLKNLRSSYSLELKKIRDSRLCGAKEYVPKVAWFYKMDGFLRDVVVPQDTNTDTNQETIYEDISINNISNSDINNSHELITSDPIEYKPLFAKLPTKGVKRKNTQIEIEKKKKQAATASSLPFPINFLELCHNKPEVTISPVIVPEPEGDIDDEFEAFAKNISHQLRTLPLDVALRMQIKIQTMLAKERLSLTGFGYSMYDNMHHYDGEEPRNNS